MSSLPSPLKSAWDRERGPVPTVNTSALGKDICALAYRGKTRRAAVVSKSVPAARSETNFFLLVKRLLLKNIHSSLKGMYRIRFRYRVCVLKRECEQVFVPRTVLFST